VNIHRGGIVQRGVLRLYLHPIEHLPVYVFVRIRTKVERAARGAGGSCHTKVVAQHLRRVYVLEAAEARRRQTRVRRGLGRAEEGIVVSVVVEIVGRVTVGNGAGPRAASERRNRAALRHARGLEEAPAGLLGKGMRRRDDRVVGGRRRGIKFAMVGLVHGERPGSHEWRLHRREGKAGLERAGRGKELVSVVGSVQTEGERGLMVAVGGVVRVMIESVLADLRIGVVGDHDAGDGMNERRELGPSLRRLSHRGRVSQKN